MTDLVYNVGYKDGANAGYELAHQDIRPLVDAVFKTLNDNLHLCDGNDCTLKDLRDAFAGLPHILTKNHNKTLKQTGQAGQVESE